MAVSSPFASCLVMRAREHRRRKCCWDWRWGWWWWPSPKWLAVYWSAALPIDGSSAHWSGQWSSADCSYWPRSHSRCLLSSTKQPQEKKLSKWPTGEGLCSATTAAPGSTYKWTRFRRNSSAAGSPATTTGSITRISRAPRRQTDTVESPRLAVKGRPLPGTVLSRFARKHRLMEERLPMWLTRVVVLTFLSPGPSTTWFF